MLISNFDDFSNSVLQMFTSNNLSRFFCFEDIKSTATTRVHLKQYPFWHRTHRKFWMYNPSHPHLNCSLVLHRAWNHWAYCPLRAFLYPHSRATTSTSIKRSTLISSRNKKPSPPLNYDYFYNHSITVISKWWCWSVSLFYYNST